MNVLKDEISEVMEWWGERSEWEKTKSITAIAVVIPSFIVMLIVQMNLMSEVREFYITPIGWALFAIAPWFFVTAYLSKADIVAAIVAKVTKRKVAVTPIEAIANDYALLMKHLAYRGPYVIAALAAPMAIGMLNIYVLWVESGATLSYSQMQTLIPMIGTFVVIVACVQLAIIMHLFSPATLNSEKVNDFVTRLRGDADV